MKSQHSCPRNMYKELWRALQLKLDSSSAETKLQNNTQYRDFARLGWNCVPKWSLQPEVWCLMHWSKILEKQAKYFYLSTYYVACFYGPIEVRTQSNLMSEEMYTVLLCPPLPVKFIITSTVWNLEDCIWKKTCQHRGSLINYQSLINVSSILQMSFHYHLLPVLSNTSCTKIMTKYPKRQHQTEVFCFPSCRKICSSSCLRSFKTTSVSDSPQTSTLRPVVAELLKIGSNI